VFVATENDSVYALDYDTGSVVWRTNLGTPINGSVLPCGDINPTGITGTPVIDPTTGTIYVVIFKIPANHFLVALSTVNGSVKFSVPADPSGSIPEVEQERGALSLANGMVYVPFGGLAGDCGAYHGWVVGVPVDGNGPMISYQVPTNREGGIWAPSGIAVDSSGDLFVATGNGDSTTIFDHGDSVIELSPTLQELAFFAPSNWAGLNGNDTDLGSVGPAVLSGGYLFQIGKEGTGYLLDPNEMGGIGGQKFEEKVCDSAFGGTAHTSRMVFVSCTDGLIGLTLSGGSFSVAWKAGSFSAGPPIITGDVVWTLDVSTGMLHGYDISSGREMFAFTTGQVVRFTTPSSAYSYLFVGAEDEVFAFELGQVVT
jgi:outer membrane protein assembly factor BamB